MDLVLLSGLTLTCAALAAMSFLIHAEVRDRRRVLDRRMPDWHAPDRRAGPSYTPSHGQWRRRAAGRPCVSRQSQRRPASPPHPPLYQRVDAWAPFVVRADTSVAELKCQYRALARRYHPDRGGDPRMMARINGLYAELLRVMSG